MSSKKHTINRLGITALLAAAFACSTRVYTPRSGPIDETYVPYHEAVVDGPSRNTAKQLVELLEDEFDYVNWFLLKSKKPNSDEEEADYVIRGHKKSGHMMVGVWGLNLSKVCKAYVLGTPIINYLLGEDVYADLKDGSIVGYTMSRKTAEIFAETLDVLVKSERNIDRCASWGKMIAERYGPYGPARD